MTLTVRLDTAIESALDRYCVDRGVTKSLVVQESLAAYLLDDATTKAAAAMNRSASSGKTISANLKAFTDAGLVGSVSVGGGADKAAVRARVSARASERKAR